MISYKRLKEIDSMTIEEKKNTEFSEEERFYILRGREMFSLLSDKEKAKRRRKLIEKAPNFFNVKNKEHNK